MGTFVLEVSTGRDLGALKGLMGDLRMSCRKTPRSRVLLQIGEGSPALSLAMDTTNNRQGPIAGGG